MLRHPLSLSGPVIVQTLDDARLGPFRALIRASLRRRPPARLTPRHQRETVNSVRSSPLLFAALCSPPEKRSILSTPLFCSTALCCSLLSFLSPASALTYFVQFFKTTSALPGSHHTIFKKNASAIVFFKNCMFIFKMVSVKPYGKTL